jgi:predicted DNA-binding protein with PD1-like motif
MKQKWETDASNPSEYHVVKVRRGREFILRLTTGADVVLAIQKFAQDHKIRFAKIHAAFMGGLQPARFLIWAPDTKDPTNWHNESPATVQNLSMILAMGGMISVRQENGRDLPFAPIHFVTGGAWNVSTMGGHLLEGSIVKGVCEVFITEILGIDLSPPTEKLTDPNAKGYPENWFTEIG